jgi:hypothetical protein
VAKVIFIGEYDVNAYLISNLMSKSNYWVLAQDPGYLDSTLVWQPKNVPSLSQLQIGGLVLRLT